MKAGDVVNFNSRSWVFKNANERYISRNPGIVVERRVLPAGTEKFLVLWADGSRTIEFEAYLQIGEE